MANLKAKATDTAVPEREAPRVDLQPEIDRKVARLNDRIALVQEQDAAELARFPAAPAPKATATK